MSWDANVNAKHQMRCCARFLTLQYGRDAIPRAYEPVSPMPLPPNALTYQPDSLNAAVACLRTFRNLRRETYWAHVAVQAIDFQSFLEAVEADRRIQTLPFSCWCDGGEYGEERHRHLIVVAPSREYFERKVWKVGRRIESSLELIDHLGFVSRRDRECPFRNDLEVYHVSESLPHDFKLVLAMQWKRGLERLVEQERHAGIMDTFRKSRFYEPSKNVLKLGERFPVTADFYPSRYPTEYFVYRWNGKKFYFDRRPTPYAYRYDKNNFLRLCREF